MMQIKDFTLTNTAKQQVSIEKDLTGKAKLVTLSWRGRFFA
jgi:hypothetical protein